MPPRDISVYFYSCKMDSRRGNKARLRLSAKRRNRRSAYYRGIRKRELSVTSNCEPEYSTSSLCNNPIVRQQLADQLQRENLQKQLELEDRNILSNNIAISNIKAEPEEDKQNINYFDKESGQTKVVLERAEIKVEVVEHDIKEEDDFINSNPKLNTYNVNVATKNLNLLSEDCKPIDAASNEASSADTECNENIITTEFVKCDRVYDEDQFYYE